MNSRTSRNHWSHRLLLATVAWLIAASWQTAAQSRGPDLLGLYLGMPDDQARKVLQSHSSVSRVELTPGQLDHFSLVVNLPGSADSIHVGTTDPAKPSVVWRVRRTLNYGDPANAAAKSTIIDALRQKYGKETALQQVTFNTTELWWLFDREGRPAPSGDLRMLKDCQTLVLQPLDARQASTQPAFMKGCYASYIAVHARLVEAKPDLLQNAEVILVSLPIGYEAALAVRKAQQSEAERQQKEELEKARQVRPKF
jgi:hypothetical protein